MRLDARHIPSVPRSSFLTAIRGTQFTAIARLGANTKHTILNAPQACTPFIPLHSVLNRDNPVLHGCIIHCWSDGRLVFHQCLRDAGVSLDLVNLGLFTVRVRAHARHSVQPLRSGHGNTRHHHRKSHDKCNQCAYHDAPLPLVLFLSTGCCVLCECGWGGECRGGAPGTRVSRSRRLRKPCRWCRPAVGR